MTEFTDAEKESRAKQAAVKAAMEQPNKAYLSGWNSALELAAFELEYKFRGAFGKDTLQSIAIYIRGMKR